jgi:hypothetical protein
VTIHLDQIESTEKILSKPFVNMPIRNAARIYDRKNTINVGIIHLDVSFSDLTYVMKPNAVIDRKMTQLVIPVGMATISWCKSAKLSGMPCSNTSETSQSNINNI